MRKFTHLLIFTIMISAGLVQGVPGEQGAQNQTEKDKGSKPRRMQIKRAYAYMEEELLVGDHDLYCSYFITNRVPEDKWIIGSEEMDLRRSTYSDGDKMYINKGATAGVQEGDMFLILEKGNKVSNKLTNKTLGRLYLPKSRAVVTCLYEDKACITLKKGCHPVHIGDLVLPFEQKTTVFKKKIDYRRCRLPQAETTVKGNVVYSSVYLDFGKEISSPQEYVTVDLGKAHLSKGNYLIFYKTLRRGLPPIIFGTGVVVNPQNTNSTVKVLSNAYPVEIGTKMILVPKSEEPVSSKDAGGEDIPVIKAGEEEVTQVEPGDESTEVGILFNINETNIADSGRYVAQFEKLKAFIETKSRYIVVLRGYTCSIGGLEYNLKLSKERVDNVKAYLVQQLGIAESVIESHFYGEKDAPHDNTSEEQRKKNRLVNIQVIGK